MKQNTKLLSLLLALILSCSPAILNAQSKLWVGSWSCAPYAAGSGNTPPSPYLANNTLRQVLRVSIGSDSLRMKFSNKTSSTATTMNRVTIALSKGGSAIDATTLKQLTFDGGASVTMAPGAEIVSDPLSFDLEPSARLAVTIHYGEASSSEDITSHVASRTDSYIVSGDQASAEDFGGATVTAHWFHINTIDVLAPDTAGCVGVLGNSITDGYGLSGGLQNRWTDFMSEELLTDERTTQVGVLNLGIGATTLAGTGATTGLSRFHDDILDQSGIRWVIIFYGVNDIGWGRSAATVIDAYQDLLDQAHALNLKVYGATITPFKGHSYYTEAHEQVREEVNAWIRTSGNFDAVIDLDKAIRDPNDTARMKSEYSNDWLHPNVAGYEQLGKSVDPGLFTEIENTTILRANAGRDQTLLVLDDSGTATVTLDGSSSLGFGTEISSYSWTLEDVEIATGISPQIDLPLGVHTISLQISDDQGNTDTDQVKINILEDSGIWLEAECATVGSLWDVDSDESASNGQYVTIQAGNNSTGGAAGAEGRLTFNFEVSEAGTYTLVARTICPNANDDSFWISMDGGSFAMWNNIGPSSNWSWESFTSGYSLAAGSHTLTISYREDGARLDKLWLTRELADVPGAGAEAGNCQTDPLVADAGVDAALCNMDGEVRLGGNPSASGGREPYTYYWSCISPDLGSFGAAMGDILDEPTGPNPLMKDIPAINDTLTLVLFVQDLSQNEVADTVEVIVSSLLIKGNTPLSDTIEVGESLTINPQNITNGLPPLNFLWSPAEGLSESSIREPLAQPDTSTLYSVEVTDALGCQVSDQVEIIVLQDTTDIRKAALKPSRIYPNPVNESSRISYTGPYVPGLEIRVYDQLGRLLFVEPAPGRAYHIGSKDLDPGVYTFYFTEGKEILSYGKFIKS